MAETKVGMITLAFEQMFYFFFISWSSYGGEDELSIYVRNGFPGLSTLDPIQFYILCFAISKLKTETGMSILVIDESVKELKNVCDSAKQYVGV